MIQKNKNIIVSILIIVLFLGGLIWLSRSAGNKQASITAGNGTLSAEETSFDFGTVSMGKGNVNHIFKIKNDGQEPAAITKIYTSCMCTTAFLVRNGKTSGPFGMPGMGADRSVKETLNPGEGAEINVVFDPAAHGPAGVGRIDRVVFVETSSGSQLQLKFAAMVNP